MDLSRARQIVEAFTADERDVVEIEVGDLYDSFDIDRNDPEQLDHWADRHMGHHEASSVDEVMLRKIAAYLRVRASELRTLRATRPEAD